MRSELSDRINFLENNEALPVESVHLTAEAEEYLFLSDPVPQNADLKIRTKISAQHLSTLADYVTFNNHVSGYILDKTAFIAGKRPHTKYFYQSFSQPFDSPYFFLKLQDHMQQFTLKVFIVRTANHMSLCFTSIYRIITCRRSAIFI